MATHTKAETQEITVTLTAAKGDMSRTCGSSRSPTRIPSTGPGPVLHANAADPETWGETLEIAHSGLKLGP